MANQYNNKVTLKNGTTLIDLTTDTVTNASHIMTGHRGHLADGSVVDGTGASESQVVSIKDVPNSTGITAEITGVPAPEGSIEISQNGTVDVTNYETAVVAVPSIDVPTFSSSDGVTITCDKTYAQCLAILNGGENRAFISFAGSNPDSLAGVNDLGILMYYYVHAGALNARIDYRSNGSITISSVDTGQTLNVTSNGTYTQSDDNAWARVNVNVPTGSATIQSLTVTANGVYTAPSGVDGYSPVTVNVAGGGGDDFKAVIERTATNPTLPDGLTVIGDHAFMNCTYLALTSLPDSVTRIESNAFNACTHLALTSLPNGLTYIGGSAFQYCYDLALTSLPSGFTGKINSYAFYKCKKIALTSLPDGITSIDTNAFSGCPGVVVTNLPDGVTSLGQSAFQGCGMTHIEGTGVTSIGGTAFTSSSTKDDAPLEEALFPNLTTMNAAFGHTTSGYACKKLEIVDAGKISTIPANAFANCQMLQTLVLRKTDAICTLANVSAFLYTPLRGYNSLTATVYVPSALIETYKTATNWSTIFNEGHLTFAAIEGSEWEL